MRIIALEIIGDLIKMFINVYVMLERVFKKIYKWDSHLLYFIPFSPIIKTRKIVETILLVILDSIR